MEFFSTEEEVLEGVPWLALAIHGVGTAGQQSVLLLQPHHLRCVLRGKPRAVYEGTGIIPHKHRTVYNPTSRKTRKIDTQEKTEGNKRGRLRGQPNPATCLNPSNTIIAKPHLVVNHCCTYTHRLEQQAVALLGAKYYNNNISA